MSSCPLPIPQITPTSLSHLLRLTRQGGKSFWSATQVARLLSLLVAVKILVMLIPNNKSLGLEHVKKGPYGGVSF